MSLFVDNLSLFIVLAAYHGVSWAQSLGYTPFEGPLTVSEEFTISWRAIYTTPFNLAIENSDFTTTIVNVIHDIPTQPAGATVHGHIGAVLTQPGTFTMKPAVTGGGPNVNSMIMPTLLTVQEAVATSGQSQSESSASIITTTVSATSGQNTETSSAPSQTSTSSPSGVVIGVIIGVLVSAVLILAGLLCWRYRRRLILARKRDSAFLDHERGNQDSSSRTHAPPRPRKQPIAAAMQLGRNGAEEQRHEDGGIHRADFRKGARGRVMQQVGNTQSENVPYFHAQDSGWRSRPEPGMVELPPKYEIV